tara:strand:+ start:8102 stop:8272 length:171 start_codon:yes stop_codon:yes gene_type:complete
MSKNILQQVLDYYQNQQNFTPKEQSIIKAKLIKEANKNLKKINKAFVQSINDINKL